MTDMTVMTFDFEEITYQVPAVSMNYAGDVVELPDGRFLQITCLESWPPQVKEITIVGGPSNVPNPNGIGEGHKGQAWKATVVN